MLKVIDQPLLENDMLSDDKKEDFSDLRETILSLDDIYRVPVVLKYLHGFAEKEIANRPSGLHLGFTNEFRKPNETSPWLASPWLVFTGAHAIYTFGF